MKNKKTRKNCRSKEKERDKQTKMKSDKQKNVLTIQTIFKMRTIIVKTAHRNEQNDK